MLGVIPIDVYDPKNVVSRAARSLEMTGFSSSSAITAAIRRFRKLSCRNRYDTKSFESIISDSNRKPNKRNMNSIESPSFPDKFRTGTRWLVCISKPNTSSRYRLSRATRDEFA